MTLSDTEIIQGLVEGQIICRPLRLENVRGASIDLTLGANFWRCDARPHGVFNPYSKDEIDRYFAGPFVAKPYASVFEKIGREDMRCRWPWPVGTKIRNPRNPVPGSKEPDFVEAPSPFENIPDDWPVIVLGPGERILAHTHEFVGIRPPRWVRGEGDHKYDFKKDRWLKGGTSQIHARSSSGRVGIKVCDDAGLGDPGYWDRWTLEMRNDNREAIIIPQGERVAQINFHETGPTRESYGTEKLYESKYQTTDDVEKMVAEWRPENMLPRNYMDRRVELGDMSLEAYEYRIRSIVEHRERERLSDISRRNRAGSDSVS